MVKLTERKALVITRDLWNWLAEHPKKEKRDWIGWRRKGGQIKEMDNDCPCCEYYNHLDTTKECEECCPLRNLWKKGCVNDNSIYLKWTETFYPNKRQEYARQIANACETELLKSRRIKSNAIK